MNYVYNEFVALSIAYLLLLCLKPLIKIYILNFIIVINTLKILRRNTY